MPKMYSLYSLASMLPRRSSHAVSSRLSRRASVSLTDGIVQFVSLVLVNARVRAPML